MIKKFKDKNPVIEKGAMLGENTVILGDVTLKEDSNIWFGTVVRADECEVIIGKGSNVQENSVIHVDKKNHVLIGEGCTIGHGAIIHGCEIEDNVLIGMGAIILNGVKIGKNSIVGAGSLITQNKKFEEGVLILGNPAKVVRKLTEEEIEANRKSYLNYIELAKECLKRF